MSEATARSASQEQRGGRVDLRRCCRFLHLVSQWLLHSGCTRRPSRHFSRFLSQTFRYFDGRVRLFTHRSTIYCTRLGSPGLERSTRESHHRKNEKKTHTWLVPFSVRVWGGPNKDGGFSNVGCASMLKVGTFANKRPKTSAFAIAGLQKCFVDVDGKERLAD